MLLTRALAPHTSSKSRTRGGEYFHAGAVVHFDPQPSLVYAVVRGGDDYVVRIEIAGAEVRTTCTCPFFNDNLEPCKHLWAVALACDARSALQLPDTLRPEAVAVIAVPLDDKPDNEWSGDDPEFRTPRDRRAKAGRTHPGQPARWQQALAAVAATAAESAARQPASGQLLYVVDLASSVQSSALVVHLLRQEQKQSGEWGVPKPARLSWGHVAALPDPDRSILERLAGGRPAYTWTWTGSDPDVPSPVQLRGAVARDLLPAMCATGRCRLAMSRVAGDRPQDSPLVPLAWDDRPPLTGVLRIVHDEAAREYTIDATLDADDESVPLGKVRLLLDDGIAVTDRRARAFDGAGLLPWLRLLHEQGSIHVPVDQASRLRAALLDSGAADRALLPEELRTTIVDVMPTPRLVIWSERQNTRTLQGELTFVYSGGPPVSNSTLTLTATRDAGVMARRSPVAEQAARDRLVALGVRASWNAWDRRQALQLPVVDVPRLVRTLVSEGWHVESDGRRYRLATAPPVLEVRAGIDWFELHGDAVFDEQRIALPTLLSALNRHGAVALDDGTYGILPEDWLRELAPLGIGARATDHIRFGRSQVALLDALLAARPAVAWDQVAAAARDRVRTLPVAPIDPPESFTGTLRGYQREALGWIASLRDLGFGGCLADDMGLGKTVVVLALLDARRRSRDIEGKPRQPSLVVVPRSVLFNWEQEAARFAPELKVLDFSGANRRDRLDQIQAHDLVLATYGTLRRDAAALADFGFDYVILDEAQTIKNATTASARAARLLNGQHRLALSGTPVENRVADLWSLFEFLNPGLLSGSTAFSRSFAGDADSDQIRALGRGLRPFILRRTKEQVATELPLKTEQTIVCDLERPQRALYNELRDHYRRELLGRGASWEKSRIQVLEALLRLRQAACHPGLLDPAKAGEPSAKLDLLVPRLIETIEEGHKALVFSQFTSFLGLLRTRLKEAGVTYEYLDGRTRDRAARIERFQSDKACGLFLISLKAGGVGLNLTAADYVFILDPWWNPAAEAQAVDRTHRIGQTRNVFAYRLIARDTVEERVLELQRRKRELADAIITADNSIVRGLGRDELEMLLS